MSIFRASLFACALALTSVACGDEKTEPPVDPVVTDDVTLEVPEANVGFQFTIPAFDIPVGAELQDCHFFEVPENPDRPGEARFISRFHARQNPGTHHMNVFRVKTRHDLYGAPGDIVKGDIPDSPCWKSSNWADWPIVVNSQESSVSGEINWTLPEGVAQRFEPGELLMLQTHYVNATTQVSDVGRGKVFVNFHEVEADKVVHEMGTMFTTNQNIRVCPGERREYEKTCNFAREEPIHIIGANGHFHSRGVRFTAYSYDAATDTKGEMFYESTRWDDPPMARDFDLVVPANGGISYTCEYEAPADSCGKEEDMCCFAFGPKVETSEHCNIFLYYWPKQADFGCF